LELKIESSKRELRILYIFSTLGVGGAETWLMALLRYIDRIKGELPFQIRIDICLTSGKKGVFDEEAASRGANLFYPHFSRSSLMTFINQFRFILSSGCYDVIHDHQDYIAGIHFLIGIGHLPLIRISHIHNPLLHLESYSRSYLRKITANVGKYLLSKLATHILGTSSQIVAEYGFNEHSFRNIKRGAVHCGFDVIRFKGSSHKNYHHVLCEEFGWDDEVKIILFVGRLNSSLNQKNPGFALEVVKACIDKNLDIRFLMAGDGADEIVEFQAKINKWDLQKSIRILGSRSDIPQLMLGSNLLLFPSFAEGLGMVAVEAQAAGLRVLASDAVPRECEVVSGMVVFKFLDDDLVSWANEALRLLGLPKPSLQICNDAIRSSPFSIESSTASLLTIYRGFDHTM
jgi:glycosyltransferase involved in cell wall biosynthesis